MNEKTAINDYVVEGLNWPDALFLAVLVLGTSYVLGKIIDM